MITQHNGVKSEILIEGVKQKRYPILYEMETSGYDFVDQYGFLREDAIVNFVKECGLEIMIKNEGRGPGCFFVNIFTPDFEGGKSYKTKMATGELFTIHKIERNKDGKPVKFWGVYEKNADILNCPIDAERLISNRKDIIKDRIDFHSTFWAEKLLQLLIPFKNETK